MRSNTYAQKIIKKVNRYGTYIHGTNEIVGFTDRILMSHSFWNNRSGANVKEMATFFDAILSGDNNYEWGPYHSEYYTFLKNAILEAAAQFVIDSPFTRRAVITFPREHCFETIQVLVRPGTFNDPDPKFTVIVNMRSCNVVDNFANDLYLSYLVASEVIRHGFGSGFGVKMGSMLINIGSLHRIIIR